MGAAAVFVSLSADMMFCLPAHGQSSSIQHSSDCSSRSRYLCSPRSIAKGRTHSQKLTRRCGWSCYWEEVCLVRGLYVYYLEAAGPCASHSEGRLSVKALPLPQDCNGQATTCCYSATVLRQHTSKHMSGRGLNPRRNLSCLACFYIPWHNGKRKSIALQHFVDERPAPLSSRAWCITPVSPINMI